MALSSQAFTFSFMNFSKSIFTFFSHKEAVKEAGWRAHGSRSGVAFLLENSPATKQSWAQALTKAEICTNARDKIQLQIKITERQSIP